MAVGVEDTFDSNVVEIAKQFHTTYESFAPHHGWETQRRSRVVWDEVPEENKTLMMAVVNKLLIDGIIEPGKNLSYGNGDVRSECDAS